MSIFGQIVGKSHVLRDALIICIATGLSFLGIGCDSVQSGGDTVAPPSPSTLTVESGNSAIYLTWSAVDASDLDRYNVYRDTTSLSDVAGKSPIDKESPTDTNFTDEAVKNGTKYHYRVTAVDESGNESSPSREAEVTPFSKPPDRP